MKSGPKNVNNCSKRRTPTPFYFHRLASLIGRCINISAVQEVFETPLKGHICKLPTLTITPGTANNDVNESPHNPRCRLRCSAWIMRLTPTHDQMLTAVRRINPARNLNGRCRCFQWDLDTVVRCCQTAGYRKQTSMKESTEHTELYLLKILMTIKKTLNFC